MTEAMIVEKSTGKKAEILSDEDKIGERKNNLKSLLGNFADTTTIKTTIEICWEPEALVLRYLREKPYLSRSGETVGNKQWLFRRGAPWGCLVAFMHENKVYIGWSKYHPKKEKSNYLKTLAREVAVYRGLTDSITFTGKTVAVNNTGKVLPSKVTKQLVSFITRVRKYFTDTTIANIFPNKITDLNKVLETSE